MICLGVVAASSSFVSFLDLSFNSPAPALLGGLGPATQGRVMAWHGWQGKGVCSSSTDPCIKRG